LQFILSQKKKNEYYYTINPIEHIIMEIIELPGSDQIRGEGTEIFLTGKKGKKTKKGRGKRKCIIK
jgi:hypothetical protein